MSTNPTPEELEAEADTYDAKAMDAARRRRPDMASSYTREAERLRSQASALRRETR